MNDSQEFTASPVGKISIKDAGLGTVDLPLLEKRARELAATDGRTEPNEADWEAAHAELMGVSHTGIAPELIDPSVEEIVEWDSPVDADGQRAPRVIPEDEANVGEVLVEEGLEEADHSQRVSAAQSDPPDEEL